jgi:hypothetical protein
MQWLQAAVSPDGSWLGLLAYQPDPSDANSRPAGAPPPPGTRAVVVAVFDPASGVQESETQTQVWRGGTSLVWSPEATRLFFTQDATHVGYVGVHSPTVHAVGVPRTIDFVVLTSPASA